MPKFKNRTGHQYGALLVQSQSPNKGRRVMWLCKCVCGKTTVANGDALEGGGTTSCGCGVHRHAAHTRDLVGRKFGKVTVLKQSPRNGRTRIHWRWRCDCGNEGVSSRDTLTSGRITSCGCGRRGPGQVNGKITPTYSSWRNMVARCTQPSATGYAHYLKLGITVCDRWRKFENFLSDMGERPQGLTIDRIDNDGNYEPGNCRWTTKRAQANNRRTNVHFSYRGTSYTLADLARKTGVGKELLRSRLMRPTGWTVEGAVKTPVMTRAKQGYRV